ncbi:S46 family peptidase [Caulobacter sp. 17J65-9]|uniref:S46 family peptidase n=1 Tax=Caulobacter sp. 17J65-9 TaxID=2709382 RepID=UPI0013CD7765|nr:S46 family peptidase [Caulobacter sp. 17J65-9]NEX91440.1 S46 family peptidase [Caulobacter sp. 17J65-9]
MTVRTLAAAAALLAFAAPAIAGEGMWTFDAFPIAKVNQALGTKIDQAWLDRVRSASVRIPGCSASLVSPDGLILTNNHCVISCAQNLSTPQQDFVANGFSPKTREEERKCPGMTAEVLTEITDVTARVQGAAAGKTGKAFTKARDAEMTAIEQEACGADKTTRCQVVSLYRGGQFKLYRYKRHTDVRLAFSPEHAAAAFGGDPDNFNFPRFAVDAGFLRIYGADGKPLSTPGHLKWNASRPTAGEPVFIAGNPGATSRLLTQSQLSTLRDVTLPLEQTTRSEFRGRLLRFREESEQNRFISADTLDGVENRYKRGRGQQRALIDPAFMAGKAREEADLIARVQADPALKAEIGDPWTDIAAVQDDYAELYPAYYFLESGAGGGSDLFAKARDLVRAAQERAKPSADRLPEYADSRLPLLEKQLLDAKPSYPELEALQLGFWLSKTREFLTADDPRVRRLLGKESPEALAQRAAQGTKVGDPAFRKALWDGGLAAVQASDDPMIRLALAMQDDARTARSQWEERVQGPTDRAAEQLARARFAVYGTDVYPDATGTLRLSWGRIEGWEQDGKMIGPFTTWSGLFDRATGSEPFVLAKQIEAAKGKLPADGVMDMTVSTDTIGGSSGSPAVNAKGELIGANFDSTFLTQRNAFGYDPRVNRSVVVSAAAITEALDKVYGQQRLVKELTGR